MIQTERQNYYFVIEAFVLLLHNDLILALWISLNNISCIRAWVNFIFFPSVFPHKNLNIVATIFLRSEEYEAEFWVFSRRYFKVFKALERRAEPQLLWKCQTWRCLVTTTNLSSWQALSRVTANFLRKQNAGCHNTSSKCTLILFGFQKSNSQSF